MAARPSIRPTRSPSSSARSGTTSKLDSLDDTSNIVTGTWGGPIELDDPDSFAAIDPHHFRLTMDDGRVFTLDRATGLQSLYDANGNGITLSPTGVTSTSGRSVGFIRDTQGRITQVTNPAGHPITYTYDAAGNLATVTDQTQATTTFTYDANHRLQQIIDPSGHRGLRTDYDADGRLISVTDATGKAITFNPNLNGRTEIMTDRLGQPTTFVYDTNGYLFSRTDALGHTISYTHDAQGNLLTESNGLQQTTTYTYDANAHLASVADPSATQQLHPQPARPGPDPDRWRWPHRHPDLRQPGQPGQRTERARQDHVLYLRPAGQPHHDARSAPEPDHLRLRRRRQPVSETDALGNTITRTFDASDNMLTETHTQTVNGVSQSIVHTFTYDARNRMLSHTDGENHTTTFTYTATGRIATQTDPDQRTTTSTYDQLDRLVRTTYPDGTFSKSVTTPKITRRASLDRANTPRSTPTTPPVTSSARPIPTAPSARRRMTRPIASSPKRTRTTTPPRSATTRPATTPHSAPGQHDLVFSFDGANRLIARTDPNLHTTTFTYDEANHRTRRELRGRQFRGSWLRPARARHKLSRPGHQRDPVRKMARPLSQVTDAANGHTTTTPGTAWANC